MADPSTADVQAELKEYLNSKNINRCVRENGDGDTSRTSEVG